VAKIDEFFQSSKGKSLNVFAPVSSLVCSNYRKDALLTQL